MFVWSEDCEKSFHELKDRLTSALVLTLSEGTNGLVVYCDASIVGLGCVLIQHGKVIAYASRKLKVHVTNYPIHDLELAAVVFSFKILRHYLYVVHIDVFTDHKSLQYVFGQKDMNLRQRRWLELLKDYDMSVLYHPDKANLVAYALSRLSMGIVAYVDDKTKDLVRDVHRLARLGVLLEYSTKGGFMVHNRSESSFVIDVRSTQDLDHILIEMKESVLKKFVEAFYQGGDEALKYQGRLCVPDGDGLRERILEQAHSSRYSIHPRATKMYHDLRDVYWWNSMKRDIVEFIAKCPNCQQVKVEHQRPGGLSQNIPIPTWKWEKINMDFIVGLPRTRRQHDSIWVIIDRMTKSSHFIRIKVSFSVEDYAKLYIRDMVKVHGVSLTIISDRDTQFTSDFLKSFKKGPGTMVKLSTAFHPQINGQAECTIQTLEDLLRAYIKDFKGNWDDQLPLLEFAYNNNYHSSIDMAPFETISGGRCRCTVGCFEVGENALIGPELVYEAIEKIRLIREWLRMGKSQKKSYADVRRRDLKFEVNV
ncbi:hypothetical protein MTR67_035003 [Solanum verrucosum]|uniref:Integrase catalytic domain-containing protein n=1 Tax=Solanum verrucosum TaxID=315347 RepID=A0AAF0U8R5_SOLVR|nr:hypothetical protein MTR67_035003 [Solanum verrucosum]